MDGGDRKIPKVLSTDEIRKRAQNWTLAGDVGLLAHLEQFSEKICIRAQETNVQFNELVDNYEELQKKISNTTNQFLSLQNSQFVENRVYDEETPTEENVKQEVVDDNEKERLLLIQYKEAVETGIKLLDTHFQEVELLPNSDSDEEEMTEGNISHIWKAKNPYAGKKFPLLIGSTEWWEDDHVGLQNFEENLETEKEISESESDLESIHGDEKRIVISSSSSNEENEKSVPIRPKFICTSSEDLFGLEKNYSFKSSTPDIFGVKANPSTEESPNFSSKSENQISSVNEFKEHSDSTVNEKEVESPPGYVSKVNKSQNVNNIFKQELEAKLGSFSKGNNVGSAEEKPFKITNEEKSFKNLVEEKSRENQIDSEDLFNETDPNDLFSEKTNNAPIGNKNLFFEAENDAQLFGGSDPLFSDSENNLFNSDNSKKFKLDLPRTDQEESKEISNQTQSKKSNDARQESMKDLFGDVFDDNELFLSEPIPTKSVNKSFSSNENDIFKEEKQPPAKIDKFSDKKKGKSKSLFDDDWEEDGINEFSDIFGTEIDQEKKQKLYPKKNVDSRLIFPSDPEEFEWNNPTVPPLENSFFKPLENSDLSGTTKRIDNDESIESSINPYGIDLFSDSPKTAKIISSSSAKSIDRNEDGLFLEKPKNPEVLSISSSRSSLFEEVQNPSKSQLASVFEKDRSHLSEEDLLNKSEGHLFGGTFLTKADKIDFFSKSAKETLDPRSLFGEEEDDDEDETDEIFTRKYLNQKEKSEEKKISSPDGIKEPEIVDVFDGEAGKRIDVWSASSLASDLTVDASNLFEEFPVESKSSRQEMEKSEKPVENFQNESKKSLEPRRNLFSDEDEEEEEDLFSAGKGKDERTKPKPPTSLNLGGDSIIEDGDSKSKVVGKLKISQNLRSKLEATMKSSGSSETGRRVEEPIKDKSDDFDRPLETACTLLKCPSKDRVKIPGRRKPQSRRARQEAIRKSGADFLIGESEKPVIEKPLPEASRETGGNAKVSPGEESTVADPSDNLFSSALSNPLSPSTDEEDFLSVPELDRNDEKEEDHRMFKNNLFQSSRSKADNSLFDGGPILSSDDSKRDSWSKNDVEGDGERDSASTFETYRSIPEEKKVSIFDFDLTDDDDDDDDENLFKSKVSKKVKNVKSLGREKKKLFESEGDVKQSLFGVEADDGEDLFGGKQDGGSFTEKLPDSKGAVEKKLSKNEITQSFMDPLGLMSSNDEQ